MRGRTKNFDEKLQKSQDISLERLGVVMGSLEPISSILIYVHVNANDIIDALKS